MKPPLRLLPLGLLMFLASALVPGPAVAQDKPLVGLIPKAARPITLDGKLDDWDGAFVTPVHVGHPDFANRGGLFYYLWDDENLYIGLRCLDQKTAHVAPDSAIYNGDAVEFYLDTRRGDKLGAKEFGPGSLHMFWTPFTKTEVKPRIQVRPLPVFKDFKLQGAEVAAEKTAWGYTCEFKLPWKNFPDFKPKADEVIGIDCELCSSDGGQRSDRTFVYSSPASVSTPAAFGRVQLVDKIDLGKLAPYARALLPLSLTKSANYEWLYGTVCVSPTIAASVASLVGKIVGEDGKERKTSTAIPQAMEGTGFTMATGKWELFDLPPGLYTLEVAALDKSKKPIVTRKLPLLHGEAAPAKKGQNPSPMNEQTRDHPRLKQEIPAGKREKLEIGTLFLPEGLSRQEQVPLFIHFHGGTWLPEVAAARLGRAAVISVQLGSGSAVYGKPFTDPETFSRLLKEAESKAGVHFEPVGLTAWSAGYGAVRQILRSPSGYNRVRFVLLVDGMHAGYEGGEPGSREVRPVAQDLDSFVKFAHDAVAGKKQFIITHSEVYPGTFASTTETADFLLKELGVARQATLAWGPMKMQQLSEARKGKLLVHGYAGNSAPDHVDHLHGLPEYLKWIEWDSPPRPK